MENTRLVGNLRHAIHAFFEPHRDETRRDNRLVHIAGATKRPCLLVGPVQSVVLRAFVQWHVLLFPVRHYRRGKEWILSGRRRVWPMEVGRGGRPSYCQVLKDFGAVVFVGFFFYGLLSVVGLMHADGRGIVS
jgi:hypothetical protein